MASETIADIADIVAEMRYGAIPKHQTDHELLAIYADRIEAAAKRDAAIHAMTCEANERLREHLEIALEDDKRTVGNAAAMREALIAMLDEKCKQCYINDQICTQGLECHWNGKRGKICQDEAMDKSIATLAAPPRECDRFADDKQADALHAAFIEHCNSCDCPMGCDHRKNPRFLLDGNCASIMKCFARFALSQATPKEGGAK